MTMEGRNWRQITWFPNYWISDRGHVFNMRTKKLQKLFVTTKGVKVVRMRKDGRYYDRAIDKLRDEAFGEPDEQTKKKEQRKPPAPRSNLH